jgi:hypothetical protein
VCSFEDSRVDISCSKQQPIVSSKPVGSLRTLIAERLALAKQTNRYDRRVTRQTQFGTRWQLMTCRVAPLSMTDDKQLRTRRDEPILIKRTTRARARAICLAAACRRRRRPVVVHDGTGEQRACSRVKRRERLARSSVAQRTRVSTVSPRKRRTNDTTANETAGRARALPDVEVEVLVERAHVAGTRRRDARGLTSEQETHTHDE